jgi:hypothetical protein
VQKHKWPKSEKFGDGFFFFLSERHSRPRFRTTLSFWCHLLMGLLSGVKENENCFLGVRGQCQGSNSGASWILNMSCTIELHPKERMRKGIVEVNGPGTSALCHLTKNAHLWLRVTWVNIIRVALDVENWVHGKICLP